jgi:hypothetical protein
MRTEKRAWHMRSLCSKAFNQIQSKAFLEARTCCIWLISHKLEQGYHQSTELTSSPHSECPIGRFQLGEQSAPSRGRASL